MRAYILRVLRDWMDMVFAKVQIMESILKIDFCGINESLVSENAGLMTVCLVQIKLKIMLLILLQHHDKNEKHQR